MRQLLQNLKDGSLTLSEIPLPQGRSNHLLIQSSRTLISAGTERMLVEFGKGSLLAKARAQPERVKQVLDKMRTDGVLPTLEAVFAKLDEPMPLGYCNAGVVLRTVERSNVGTFNVGDRVVSNGPHAEVVCVPQNLCARIPDEVTDEEAAFTVLGAIALQGIRLAQPTLGETVAVLGLGLVGLMTVQLLQANGCRVLGFDTNPDRVKLANSVLNVQRSTFNVSTDLDPVKCAAELTDGRGVDAVLITASTASSEPVHQAAQMCRKRGRIVLVGVTGLELNRADFYEKELTFQVSCSYGPGRYDPSYEEQGHDYPLGYVRWTEQRNFEAVLELMATGKLDVKPLISHRFPFEQAPDAYELITSRKEPYLGIILEYGKENAEWGVGSSESRMRSEERNTVVLNSTAHQPTNLSTVPKRNTQPATHNSQPVTASVIGAGNFTKQVILPALKRTPAILKTIASSGGVSGTHLGKKFGFEQSTTDYHTILADPDIQAVFITTRHHQHARMVVEALQAGKHVFVEKPLAISGEQLDEVVVAVQRSTLNVQHSNVLHVGFNRRFAPHVQKMKQLLQNRTQPLAMVMTVNAGMIPSEHWIQDPEVGGGRIIGEGCHFIDLLVFLADAPVVKVSGQRMGTRKTRWDDVVSFTLHLADGSVGTVHYLANGHRRYPKERLEVFSEGRVLVLDNFRRLTGHGWKGFRSMRTRRQDKGHRAEIAAFVERVGNGGEPLIPFEQLVNVTQATFAVVEEAVRGSRMYEFGVANAECGRG